MLESWCGLVASEFLCVITIIIIMETVCIEEANEWRERDLINIIAYLLVCEFLIPNCRLKCSFFFSFFFNFISKNQI